MSETTWAENVTDRREQLAELLHKERKAHKIRQQQLAHKLGQPQSRISRIENGEHHIDVGEFLALADAIGFDPGIALRKIQGATCNGGRAVDEALAVVKAAGYRVAKPKPRKHKDRVGPTFVAEFADGTVTRMSTFTSLEKLDWGRGVRLSQAAYQSRWRARERAQCLVDPDAPVLPAIISMHFEQNGKVLAQRNGGSVS
jgi:transcriptional regulator with XRE-family HTH domain